MQELTPRDQAVIEALTTVARPIILEEFRPDSCIVSTRLGIDALTFFGIKAVPIPLTVVVFNREATELVANGMTLEELNEVTAKIPATQPGGPWSIGVGTGLANTDTTWGGHVAIGVPSTGTYIDLSIDQASRPIKNMTLKPLWVTFGLEKWWNTNHPDHDPVQQFQNDQGCTLFLDRRTSDPEGFRVSRNWTKQDNGVFGPSDYKAMTGRIIRAVRAHI